MTNKEAITEIKKWIEHCPIEYTAKAFDLAIKALEFQDKVKEACCFLCGFELESYIRGILKEAEND